MKTSTKSYVNLFGKKFISETEFIKSQIKLSRKIKSFLKLLDLLKLVLLKIARSFEI